MTRDSKASGSKQGLMSIEVLRLMFQHADIEIDGRMLPTGLPQEIPEEEFQSVWNQARLLETHETPLCPRDVCL